MKAFGKLSEKLGRKVKVPVVGSVSVGGMIATGVYVIFSAISGYVQEQRTERAIKTAVQTELLDLLKKMNESN